MKKECISNDWYFKEDWLGGNCDWSGGDKEWYLVDLPHDYAMVRGRSPQFVHHTGHYEGGSGRYKKYIKFNKKQHVILDIDGAYMCAEIRINKSFIDIHPHGYTPYLVDMTDEIVVGCHNRIYIKTDDNHPSSRWYSGAGLYRDVFLWTGGDVRIEPRDLYVTTEEANEKEAKITVHVWISSDYDCRAKLRINVAGEEVLEYVDTKENEKVKLDIPVTVKNPRLWDIGQGNLYKLSASLEVDGQVIDEYEQNIGIRKVEFSASEGVKINGRRIKLQGGCIHHDHGGLGACAYPAAEKRKITNLQDAGYNAVRIAHNPPSTALMEVCDSLGMLVMTEAFDMWNCEKTSRDYHLFFKDWCLKDIKYMVERDRSHPCIISYSIGNEIHERDCNHKGAYWSKALSDEVRRYDTSRPVTAAICGYWEEVDNEAPEDYKQMVSFETDDVMIHSKEYFESFDILGCNYMYDQYDKNIESNPDRILWSSETQVMPFYDSWSKVLKYDNLLGDFTWTAYDNIGETGAGRFEWGSNEEFLTKLVINKYPWRTCFQGDFDLAGFRRPQSYFREAIWKENTEPKIFAVHPKHYGEPFAGTCWHWYDVADTWTFEDEYIGKKCTCHVYTLADEVRFTLNDVVVGTVKPEKAIAVIDIPYEKGTLSAEAIKDGKVVGKSELKTTGIATKIGVKSDRCEMLSDGRDLCFFEITVEDEHGEKVTLSEAEISAKVEGGELLCMYSGQPANEDDFTAGRCHAFFGRAIAVVKTKTPGKVSITVTGEGLASGTADVTAK